MPRSTRLVTAVLLVAPGLALSHNARADDPADGRLWRGRLSAVLDTGPRRVELRLTPSSGAPGLEAIVGDRLLTSDLPALSSQGIHVWEITVFFERE